ncbi:MAG: hydrogen peroxide-dependent heme synthase [Pseudomonadota bacterium]
MAEAPGTLEGWYALHDFRRIDWGGLNRLPAGERQAVLEEAAAFFQEAEAVKDAPEGSSALYTVIGHKADLLILHLRPTMDQLAALERAFNRTRLAAFTSQPYSYFSVTELSLYEASARGGGESPEELMKNPFVQKRLKPSIPDHPYVCFYPMNKKRGETVNWYLASMEERRAQMKQHALTGRKFQESITQMITGSYGLDDWEWGVTLFAVDPLPVKKIVQEMRFDEVSAKYAEFGAFLNGIRVKPADLPAVLMER